MKTKKAQSALEYAAMIGVIVISVITMTTYIQRSISAKVENVRQDLNRSVR